MENYINLLRLNLSKMGKPSKQERILELFFNEPSKHWHFKEIVKTAKISEPSASKWLNLLQKEKIVQRIKPRGKMPYFTGNYKHENYRNKKKLYALQKMYETGLFQELQKLENAKTIIIFGSYARSDWNTQSDVDVFILGDSEEFKFGRHWTGLGFQGKSREVQVHTFVDKQEINQIKSGLMKNVVKGYFIKGDVHDIAEVRT
ncbi:nucleotidyltransferase domain-containing protein [Candidatus Woesearchaeota archaeon]|nr:nucleotidyltransferase domain-containing protein [Candidatus Woesearchaeota archaeon]